MGYVKENPVCGVKPVKTAAYEIRFLNEPAVEEVLRRAAAHALHPVLATAVYAGLREAELAALEWPSVNFREGFIAVRNTESFRTKSRKPRLVPLAPALREILEPLSKGERGRAREGLCFPCEVPQGGRVGARAANESKPRTYKGVTLTHRVGRLCDSINRARTKEALDAGTKKPASIDFTLHTLRRTFATHLRMSGVPLDKISRWLGDSSVRVTEGWYADMPFDGPTTRSRLSTFGRTLRLPTPKATRARASRTGQTLDRPRNNRRKLVRAAGIEPATSGLKGRCSTD